MDVVKLTPRMLAAIPTGSAARTCPHCGLANRPGQYVLRERLRSRAFADTLRLIHVNPCLRRIVEATPDVDEADPTTIDVRLDQERRAYEESLRAS